MNIRNIKYIISVLAALIYSSISYAQLNDEKIKLNRPVTPPLEQAKAQYKYPFRMQNTKTSETPSPQWINADVDGCEVTLTWNNPERINGLFEDFESHDDFVINSPGELGWQYLDQDQLNTYVPSACIFPNMGQKMAYIIMNPSKTSPAWTNPSIQAFSGEKFLAAFTVDGGNNDWIISRELDFDKDFKFSFQAKTYHPTYGLERIKVGYSMTGTQPSDFIFVNQGDYDEVPLEWTLMNYDIPAGAKYITINCVSFEAFVLLIDDIFIGTNNVRPNTKNGDNVLIGYNLYRDGTLINSSMITENSYKDSITVFKEYIYQVRSIYSITGESDEYAEVSVDVNDPRALPFYDNFRSWSFETNGWELPEGSSSRWSVNYYEFGWMEPCATYRILADYDYSQSLVSKELYTTDTDNVMLRFNLRNKRIQDNYRNYLEIEISADKVNWTNVDELVSLQFIPLVTDYRHYDLSSFIDNNSFYIRFRVHGGYTYYIEYWYLDEIKIWNPIWTDGKISVNALGSQLASCNVKLTNSDGIPYYYTTDLNGNIVLDRIEEDTYTVSISQDGFNNYEEKWILNKDNNNELVINLTAPVLSLDRNIIHSDLNAEAIQTENIILKNTGTGPVRWKLDQQHQEKSGITTDRWAFQGSFRASGDIQSAVGFDGEFYYTGSWLFQGVFYKYDSEGNFMEEFEIPGIYTGIGSMAYDGQYFYAGNTKNRIYKIDMRNKTLVEEIVVSAYPALEIRHCTYDPRNEGTLWVGDSNSICQINLQGEVCGNALRDIISGGYEYAHASGSAFDNITPGGPYIWFSCSSNSNTEGNTFDQVTLRQYSLSSMAMTNVKYFVGDIPGYINGSASTGIVYVGSLFPSFDVEEGTFSLVGTLSNSPTTIYKLKLCDLPTWLTYSPKQGTLPAAEEQKIEFVINSIDGQLNENYSTMLSFNNVPTFSLSDINISYKVVDKAINARPINVDVQNEGKEALKISWEEGDGLKSPTGYNIYRNDSLINLQPLTEKSFIDDKLLRGVYRYSVTALYDDQSSQHSDEVSGFVKFGIPCYPPAALSAQVIKNKNVNLSWTSPEETGNVAKVLRWDNGVNTNAVGIKGGGTFFAGSLWEYEDLINYRGMEISEVEIIINDFLDALVLCIFKDNDQIYTQGVPSSNIVYGSPVKVVLNEPVIIEPGYSYNIAFRVTHAGDKSPVGLDASAVVEGKGNIISTDGKSWYALTRIGASEGNFNISYILQPGNSSECQQIVIPEKKKSVFVEAENKANFELMQSSVEVPVVSLLSTEAALLGYNIYREGEQINDQIIPENSYSDLCTLPGDYTYNVTSVYSLGESQFSNNTNINILNIDSYNVPYGFRSEVELNRKITLSWGYPTKEVSLLGEYLPNDVISPVSYPTYINSWNATLNSETGVASDGKFLYTSIWNISGMFNKYTLDGQFVETFVIDGVDALRNLTCDGTYFYGGATGSTVFKLDFENKELIETFSVSEIVRHCTYIPDLNNGEGGFEVGDWETSIYVSKSGAKIGTGPSLLGAFGTAYHDGYIYAFEQSSENHYSIGKYDYKTLARVDEINPDYYDGLNITSGMLAGGLSAFTTQEGVVVMGATFQNTQNNKIVLFELDGVSGVEGYNIYCNDEKINDNILTGRMFIDYQYTPGQYAYQIETVYIDEMLSPRSEEQIIDIIQNGVCDSAEPVKIIQSVSGYNLLLSFVNPDIESVDFYENISQFNSGDIFTQEGWINTNESDLKPWKVTSEYSYHGNNSLISKPEENRSDWLITPELNFDSDYVFSFVGRINDNTSGNGSLKIYTSTGSNNFVDFSLKEIVSTEELWKKYELNIDKQVKYIAIVNSENDKASQFVDAISIDKTAETSVFGYDIYRNGEKMNNNPVTTISYFDHNLAPGEYTYQVYTLYKDGCISDLSEPAEFNLEYDLPLAAPESLTAIVKEDGVQLDWSLPAISEAINLGWDSGRNYNAAGLPSGGSFYAGIKFAPEDMLTVKNMCISHAEIFIDTPPDALFLLIYEENKLIYQQYVPEVLQCSFNKINLDTPLQINMEKELKVIFYMEHNSISTPIGFDEGPGVSEKGNLYSTDGINWTTIYDDSYGYIDANWNISAGFKAYQNTYQTAKAPEEGIVFEPRNTAVVNESLISKEMDMVKSSESRRLYGYNVYRNSDRINEEICTNLSYLDQELTNNVYYEYYVTAVYSQNIEVESNRILIVTTGTMDIQNCQSEVILLDDILYIRGVKEGSLIEIYSPSGLIHYRDLADGNVLTYDMSNFADGVYFVRIADSGKVINVKKILK